MPGKEKIKILFSYITALNFVFGYIGTPAVLCINISEQKKLKEDLQSRKKSLVDVLKSAKENVSSEAKNKNSLDEKIKAVQNNIDKSNEYINELDNKILAIQNHIGEIKEEIKRKTELLKEALFSIYVAGDTQTLDIILDAQDLEDLMDKMDIVRFVGSTVKELIDGLNESLLEVENQEKEITKVKSSKEDEKAQLEKSKNELQELLDKSEKLLEEYQDSEKSAKQNIDHNDAEIKAIDLQIERYYEEERRKEEARKKAAQNNSKVPETPAVVHHGKLLWPVPGFDLITSNYRDTQNRRSAHGAMDIAGKGVYGASIRAAGSGTVIMVNTSVDACGQGGGGYGKFVVIDHGNGLSTLYGHMSLVSVSRGQRVSAGEKIGNVGNTGHSTGPHLHFEVREKGKRVDPALYI